MYIFEHMDANLLQLYISRGVQLLPSTYVAFLDILSEMERKRTVCLVPLARFELFHHKLNPKQCQPKKPPTPVKVAS